MTENRKQNYYNFCVDCIHRYYIIFDMCSLHVYILIEGRKIFFRSLGAHVNFARTHGALLLAVEHRFYGESLNPDGLELVNLKYLSSQQALVVHVESNSSIAMLSKYLPTWVGSIVLDDPRLNEPFTYATVLQRRAKSVEDLWVP